MSTTEYKTALALLTSEYDATLAERALCWFLTNHSRAFAKCVHVVPYCIANELLWN